MTTSTFDTNTAIQGGSIFNNAIATITGSTLSNSNAFQGGAIANDLIATLTLTQQHHRRQLCRPERRRDQPGRHPDRHQLDNRRQQRRARGRRRRN